MPLRPENPTEPVPRPAYTPSEMRVLPPLTTRGALIPRVSASIVAVSALVVLIGWGLDQGFVRSLGSVSRGAVNPVATLLFLATAAGLSLSSVERVPKGRAVALVLAGMVVIVGVARLIGGALGVTRIVDTWLFREAMQQTGDGRLNLMSPASATSFVLRGVALSLPATRCAGARPSRRYWRSPSSFCR